MSYVEHLVNDEDAAAGTAFVPHGVCGANNRMAWCTLATGHAGPHEARGYGDRLIDSWLEPAAEDGASS